MNSRRSRFAVFEVGRAVDSGLFSGSILRRGAGANTAPSLEGESETCGSGLSSDESFGLRLLFPPIAFIRYSPEILRIHCTLRNPRVTYRFFPGKSSTFDVIIASCWDEGRGWFTSELGIDEWTYLCRSEAGDCVSFRCAESINTCGFDRRNASFASQKRVPR
jgi:hypothetical protein